MIFRWLARAVSRGRSQWWWMRLKLDARLNGGRVELAQTVRLRTRVIFRGRGTVRIGEHTTLGQIDGGLPHAPILFTARRANSLIDIGAASRLANGVEMIALERIELGERVLAGAGLRILDSDFHGVELTERESDGRSAPVLIGDNVFIGMGVMVLKGVSIGDGAVIGAGAVVARDVPASKVASGNPARLHAIHVA